MTSPTFGAANVAARTGSSATLKINEWLTSENVRLTEDFVELYNPDALPVSLTGLFLTDNPINQFGKHQIGALSFVGGGGFVSFVADGKSDNGSNHLNFKLSPGIEGIGLYDASLNQIDRILHLDQTADVSQGRRPDGSAYPYQYYTAPTPGVANANTTAITDLVNNLRVTELMYNPQVDADLEFVELLNTSGAVTLDLTGVRLGGGINFVFPSMKLLPGKYVVVTRNLRAFVEHFGSGINVAGQYNGNLNDTGDQLVLQLPAPYDAAILRFAYDNLSHPSTDGMGYSLTIRSSSALAASWNDAASWQVGTVLNGSPGRSDAGVVAPRIVINEVLTHTLDPLVDAIELYNPTSGSIAIGGWYLSDSNNDFQKFQIPANTTIAAHGYLVYYEGRWINHVLAFDTATEFGGTGLKDFALNAYMGDQVWLTATDGSGNVTEVVDVVDFGAVAAGESLGRWPNGTGNLYPMLNRTFDAPNNANDSAGNGPRVGPLVINEVMYRPTGALSTTELTAGFTDLNQMEFVEIQNPTAAAVDLARWQLAGGVSYPFAAGTTLLPGAALAVVSFDPSNAAMLAAFRARYGATGTLAVAGPYSGHLNVLGEKVQLIRAGQPPLDNSAFYPALLEDEVAYSPTWGANGDGLSLHRVASNLWGDAQSSWTAAAPTLPAFVINPNIVINGDATPDFADIVRVVRNGAMLDIFVNSATPTLSQDFLTIQAITFNGLGGIDRLIVDESQGLAIPTGGISFAGGGAADMLEISGALATQPFTLLAGQVRDGVRSISYTDVEGLDLKTGAYTASADLAGVNIDANAALTLSTTQHLGTLSIASGVTVQTPAAGGNLLKLKQLVVDGPGAALDLFSNSLILEAADSAAAQTALAYLTQRIASARNTGATLWTGPGLTSTTARADAKAATGLAIILNDDGNGNPIYSTFGPAGSEEPASAKCVLVKYTLNGDANLDGKIDARDYFRIDRGLLTGSTTYADGNFDYASGIDADDFHLIDWAYLNQASSGSAAAASSSAPPTTLFSTTPIQPSAAPLSAVVAPRTTSQPPTISNPNASLFSDEQSIFEM